MTWTSCDDVESELLEEDSTDESAEGTESRISPGPRVRNLRLSPCSNTSRLSAVGFVLVSLAAVLAMWKFGKFGSEAGFSRVAVADATSGTLSEGSDCLQACGNEGLCKECGVDMACCSLTLFGQEVVLECSGTRPNSSQELPQDPQHKYACVKARLPDDLVVKARSQTQRVSNSVNHSNADDTAVMVSPSRRIWIAATLKRGGLDLVNLQGQTVYHIDALPGSRYNNVNRLRDLFVVSDRGRDVLRFFRVQESAYSVSLEDVTDPDVPLIFSHEPGAAMSSATGFQRYSLDKQYTAYGLACATLPDDADVCFVTRHWQGHVMKLTIQRKGDKVTYEAAQSLQLPMRFNNKFTDGKLWEACSPTDSTSLGAEGLVIDAAQDRIFIGQEWLGLYVANVSNFALESLALIDVTDVFNQEYRRSIKSPDIGLYECDYASNPAANIHRDIEGLALYEKSDGKGYLLMSAQGANRVNVYSREHPFTFLGAFKVQRPEDDTSYVHHTDGVEVSSENLGEGFERGIIIVQDDLADHTRFEFVSWHSLERAALTAGNALRSSHS